MIGRLSWLVGAEFYLYSPKKKKLFLLLMTDWCERWQRMGVFSVKFSIENLEGGS